MAVMSFDEPLFHTLEIDFSIEDGPGVEKKYESLEVGVSVDNYQQYPMDDSFPEGVSMPGFGDVSNELCGKIRSLGISVNKEISKKLYSCKKQGCPVCYPSWFNIQGTRSGKTIAKMELLTGCEVRHWWYSPKIEGENVDIKQIVSEFRKFVKKYHDSGDKLGYVYIVHPGRLYCKSCYDSEVRRPRSKYEFKTVRAGEAGRVCAICGQSRGLLWYFSPHIHFLSNFRCDLGLVKERFSGKLFVGYGRVSRPEVSEHDKRVLGIRGEREKGLIDKMQYLLSHSLYKPKGHSVIYCGAYSHKNMIVARDEKQVPDLDSRLEPFYIPRCKKGCVVTGERIYKYFRGGVEYTQMDLVSSDYVLMDEKGNVQLITDSKGKIFFERDGNYNVKKLMRKIENIRVYYRTPEITDLFRSCKKCKLKKKCKGYCVPASEGGECMEFFGDILGDPTGHDLEILIGS